MVFVLVLEEIHNQRSIQLSSKIAAAPWTCDEPLPRPGSIDEEANSLSSISNPCMGKTYAIMNLQLLRVCRKNEWGSSGERSNKYGIGEIMRCWDVLRWFWLPRRGEYMNRWGLLKLMWSLLKIGTVSTSPYDYLYIHRLDIASRRNLSTLII